MERSGNVHAHTRPLSAATLPALLDVVAEVQRELGVDGVSRAIEQDRLETLIRDMYHDVDPWPFAALV